MKSNRITVKVVRTGESIRSLILENNKRPVIVAISKLDDGRFDLDVEMVMSAIDTGEITAENYKYVRVKAGAITYDC